MAALAVLTSFISMTLREAEWCAWRASIQLNQRDIFGYACTFVFDVILILGLMVGAGIWTSFDRFLTFALLVGAMVVVAVVWDARNDYDPPLSEPGLRRRHWHGPLALLVGIILIWLYKGGQVPVGSQPFVLLLGVSITMSRLHSETQFAGLARLARSAMLVGSLVLILWNTVQLS